MSPPGGADFLSLPLLGDFEAASRAVLSMFHKRLGFGLWMVTRTEGEEWMPGGR